MKELFGLKDKEGKEYKLLADNYRDGYTFSAIMPVESPQEFKVGDWIIGTRINALPFRLPDIETVDYIREFEYCYYRPATPQEIESYLIKEAEKRGFVGKCKFRCTNGYLSTQLPQWDFFYLSGADALVTHVVETSSNRAVYCQGKWAEIIPQKKSLPKTKSEFRYFLMEYTVGSTCHGKDVVDFLADFED